MQPHNCSYKIRLLAAAAATVVVVGAAVAAIVIVIAAAESTVLAQKEYDDQNENPCAAVAAEKTVHVVSPPLVWVTIHTMTDAQKCYIGQSQTKSKITVTVYLALTKSSTNTDKISKREKGEVKVVRKPAKRAGVGERGEDEERRTKLRWRD